MRTATLLPVLLLAVSAFPTGSVYAQQFVPDGFNTGTTDNSSLTIYPFGAGVVNGRVQWFYSQTRAGFGGPVTLSSLDLRWDGPLPAVGSPAPINVQDIEIRIGTTTTARPGAVFGDNLSQPLTLVFDGPKTYFPDQGSFFPEAWGGLNGSLSFPFLQPVTLQVPANGWLVVDMRIRGNLFLQGFAHSILDAERGFGGPVDGTVVDTGAGCTVPGESQPLVCSTDVVATPAPNDSDGFALRANGSPFFLTASGLPANGFGVLAVGLDDTMGPLGALPTPLPGTSCSLRTSGEYLRFVFADGFGNVDRFNPGSLVALPYLPGLTGLTVHAQVIVPTAGFGAFGLAASNLHSVTLGDYQPLADGLFTVVNRDSADAAVANRFEVKAPAIRFQ